MNISDLTDMVPGLMAKHPSHGWTMASGQPDTRDPILDIYPLAASDRKAQVQIGLEIFFLDFAGHRTADFAYTDRDRVEVLEQRLELAARATLGPTRVTLYRVDGQIVRSTMVIDPDGPDREEDTIMTTTGHFVARLLRRQVLPEVLDFPAVTA
ncbi:hypothetical protein [Humibacillus sp. DSM 29435]|uniref:hypothetical protein n=1 Tax=Humibacillus sp. DSM 29435 TaxID=1869167 RepID=UPI001113182A|nr:hypothetical protein [Humibacillus sp. DSM 29435]